MARPWEEVAVDPLHEHVAPGCIRPPPGFHVVLSVGPRCGGCCYAEDYVGGVWRRGRSGVGAGAGGGSGENGGVKPRIVEEEDVEDVYK